MLCRKCQKSIPEESIYCMFCGVKQVQEHHARKKANGEGTVYKLKNGKYKAVYVAGWRTDDSGKAHSIRRTKTCDTKKDAIAAIQELAKAPAARQKVIPTFRELYEKWLPTHQASKSTLDCYKAAFRFFDDVSWMKMDSIDIDDLQECVDDCGKGKRTKQNMKAVCGLVYKYGIPRNAVPSGLNLAQYIRINDDGETAHRASFSDDEIERIRKIVGYVPYADYVYCMIYLGFRPSEFLGIKKSAYSAEKQAIIGGGKTEAGTDRTVTISPKIKNWVALAAQRSTGEYLFSGEDGKQLKYNYFADKIFPAVLQEAGIDNPIVGEGDAARRKFTPHSCRHTFATLMKNVAASDKDKLELIGHTSTEMLRYYQDVNLDDLKKITDIL